MYDVRRASVYECTYAYVCVCESKFVYVQCYVLVFMNLLMHMYVFVSVSLCMYSECYVLVFMNIRMRMYMR